MLGHERHRIFVWYFVLAAGMFLLFVAQHHTAGATPWFGLFGRKTTATCDLWAFGHVLFGISLAGLGERLTREPCEKTLWLSRWFLLALTVLCVWEALELPMELGFLGPPHVAVWKAGVEHWSNRFIGDPLAGVVGCVVYRRFPRAFAPAVVLGVAWWIFNAMMPTCMTIQEHIF